MSRFPYRTYRGCPVGGGGVKAGPGRVGAPRAGSREMAGAWRWRSPFGPPEGHGRLRAADDGGQRRPPRPFGSRRDPGFGPPGESRRPWGRRGRTWSRGTPRVPVAAGLIVAEPGRERCCRGGGGVRGPPRDGRGPGRRRRRHGPADGRVRCVRPPVQARRKTPERAGTVKDEATSPTPRTAVRTRPSRSPHTCVHLHRLIWIRRNLRHWPHSRGAPGHKGVGRRGYRRRGCLTHVLLG